MSFSHCAEPVAVPNPTAALGSLRARGLRISATRRLVVDALFDAEAPVTAEAIARTAGADLASVYRNLETLESIGIVRHVHLGHGPGLYTLVATSGDIEYLACERCGAYEAVDPARLDEARAVIEREVGYRARFTHFPIVGLCPACSSNPTPKERRPHAHT
jgi:Fur family ferric uptake transcriptional regulator